MGEAGRQVIRCRLSALSYQPSAISCQLSAKIQSPYPSLRKELLLDYRQPGISRLLMSDS
jgi:hypothetical protein